jgi:hypothetical protein
MIPVPQAFVGEGDRSRDIFESLGPFALRASHLASRLCKLPLDRTGERPQPDATPQAPANAVAVAGLNATADTRRRAVVLLLGTDNGDTSSITPRTARAFLADLHAPLFVWAAQPGAQVAEQWGAVEDASSEKLIDAAAAHLAKALESQHIVWLEGAHLPQRIGLADTARGASLAQ